MALRQILSGGLIAAGVLVGHEEVAKVDVKIGFVGPDIGQRLEIHIRAGMLVQVRIRRQGEGEAATRRARSVESVFWAAGELSGAGRTRAKLVVVTGVGLHAP